MKNKNLLILLLVVLLGACRSTEVLHQPKTVESLYRKSIENAMSPGPEKIDTNLVAINSQNKHLIWKKIHGEDYILVVTWKQNVSYYKPFVDSAAYNTGGYPIWVTTAPELLERMEQEKIKDVNLRLIQLLGLPPNAVYSYFVEFWVKPEELFRPCPDNEIDDGRCDLCFPDNTDSTYIAWINSNRISRYYQCELYDNYPWTQLGYTYDWNPRNKSHVGLSEFVIGKDEDIYVNAIYSTKDYLKKNFSQE